MNFKKICFLFFVLTSVQLNANINKNTVKFTIYVDTIILENTNTFQVDVLIENNTRENLIFFGHYYSEPLVTSIDYLLNHGTPGGNTLIIKNDSTFFSYSIWEGFKGNEYAITKDSVEAFFTKTSKKLKNESFVLNSGDTVTKKLNIDLTKYKLKPGVYSFYFIYCCNKHLENFVTKEEQREMEKKYDAKVFRGCIQTVNEAVLIIK